MSAGGLHFGQHRGRQKRQYGRTARQPARMRILLSTQPERLSGRDRNADPADRGTLAASRWRSMRRVCGEYLRCLKLQPTPKQRSGVHFCWVIPAGYDAI